MSTRKPHQAGTPVYAEPQPRLRLVARTDQRPQAKPDPELRALLDEMQRRDRVQRERQTDAPDEPEAA